MHPVTLIPSVLALVLVVVACGAVLMWRRDGRLRKQRELLRRTYELGEEILGASSPDQILSKVCQVVPKIFGVSSAALYLYNRHAKTLETVERPGVEPVSIPLSSRPVGPPAGAVACFHYRTLLAIPDASRSPFPITGEPGAAVPRSLLFVPMLAQGEVVGILEMDRHDRARDFSRDQQVLAQHLANQIGVAVKLLDQMTVREQLHRTEKLAAVGQLISGIVNDLRTPLAAISNFARPPRTESRDFPSPDRLAAIAFEADRASEMVHRLMGFAGSGEAEPQPVEINELLGNLIEFREREWKARGIRVRNLLAEEPITVMGSPGQLEQVFLNLLVHAEQSLLDSTEKLITIRSSLIARRTLVEIAFSGPHTGVDPFSQGPENIAGGAGLGVCHSLVTGHGGEIRLVQPAAANPAFQVELPVVRREKPAAPVESGRDSSRMLTALLIEPAESVQAELRSLLAARGYRVVPVRSSDEGLDLAQRMRFDAIFCSVHAPGLNWVETAERLKSRVGGFVLLSDSYDPDLVANFEGESCFVLAKPIAGKRLDRVLESIPAAVRSASLPPR
jgi:signal transduction histidine kinase/CheY-like chemotaxis protein